MAKQIDFTKATDLQLFIILHFDHCSKEDKENAFRVLKNRKSIYVTHRESA
jgi:hypothetical protein